MLWGSPLCNCVIDSRDWRENPAKVVSAFKDSKYDAITFV